MKKINYIKIQIMLWGLLSLSNASILFIANERYLLTVNDEGVCDTILIGKSKMTHLDYNSLSNSCYFLMDKDIYRLNLQNFNLTKVTHFKKIENYAINECGSIVFSYFNKKWDNVVKLLKFGEQLEIIKIFPKGEEWVTNLEYKGNTIIIETTDDSPNIWNYIYDTKKGNLKQIELGRLFGVELLDQESFYGFIEPLMPIRIIFSYVNQLDKYLILVDSFRDKIPLYNYSAVFDDNMNCYFLGNALIDTSIKNEDEFSNFLMNNSMSKPVYLYKIDFNRKKINKIRMGDFIWLCLYNNNKIYFIHNERKYLNEKFYDLSYIDLSTNHIKTILEGFNYLVLKNKMFYYKE